MLTVNLLFVQLEIAETEEVYNSVMSTCDWRFSIDGLAGIQKFVDREKFKSMANLHFGIVVIQKKWNDGVLGLFVHIV